MEEKTIHSSSHPLLVSIQRYKKAVSINYFFCKCTVHYKLTGDFLSVKRTCYLLLWPGGRNISYTTAVVFLFYLFVSQLIVGRYSGKY